MNLELLKKQKVQLKASLTRFCTFIEMKGAEEIVQLQIRKSDIENSLQTFTDLCNKLVAVDSEREINYLNELEEFENKYYNAMTDAVNLINSVSSNKVKKEEPQPDPKVKLPVMKLPTFSGNYEEFFEFHDSFNALINNNNKLSNIERFQYLKRALTGEAANVIHSIQLSDRNYKLAWDLIIERYKNEEQIVLSHIKALFNLPKMQKESAVALRSLIDNFLKHIRALTVLGQPTDSWDALLIYLFTNKLDQKTFKEWESSRTSQDLPSLDELLKFLKHYCVVLETIAKNSDTNLHTKPISSPKSSKKISSFIATKTKLSCYYCKENHFIYQCKEFLKLAVKDRISNIKRLGLCLNCFRNNHQTKDCISSCCKTCNKKHNTLLHLISETTNSEASAEPTTVQVGLVNNYFGQYGKVILSTALVEITDDKGITHTFRAILDSGSQASFMTERCSQQLAIKRSKININISGIDQTMTKASQSLGATIKSRFNNFKTYVKFLVVSKLSEKLPISSIDISNIGIPSNIMLADPTFNKPNKVDLLLGADVFWKLLSVGQIKLNNSSIILNKTVLGWIVAGKVSDQVAAVESCDNISNFHALTENLERELQKFWNIEEVSNEPNSTWTCEERLCERHFVETHYRTLEGRFVVRLPFKNDPDLVLGESKEQAMKRLYALERRLDRFPLMKQQYVDFINEYQALDHMEIAPDSNEGYFMPHHPVFKESTTTKLRVVFDASAQTTSGISLNELLMKGPTIQADIVNTLIKFRKYKIALSGDLEKMFRQIAIHEDCKQYQKILWREKKDDKIKTYFLNTVTYGTTTAPFLAVRVLHQLAHEEMQRYPKAAQELLSSFYADDYLSGAQTIEEAINLRKELSELLRRGGFNLRKWSTSSKEVLEEIPKTERETKSIYKITDEQNAIKTLGLLWIPETDIFKFSINLIADKQPVTKRSILSVIAKLYDPLGLLGPIIISAKILLQKLWCLKIAWDESLPQNIHSEWEQYRKQLTLINELNIPRVILDINNSDIIEIHGFADASQQAYGACIYIRSFLNTNNVSTNLICAKSRVAPLKNVSIPRLELCAALLLVHLMKRVIISLNIDVNKIFYWTDSSITIAWINTTSAHLKTFVANRVSVIQQHTNPAQWGHVSSENNPADLISRGVHSQTLLESEIWWKGPDWLREGSLSTSTFSYPSSDKMERRIVSYLANETIKILAHLDSEFYNNLIKRYSSLSTLIRVLAYVKRFIRTIKNHRRPDTEFLTIFELQESLNCLIKHIQLQAFKKEIQALNQGNSISAKSKMKFLNPFIDSSGILRVGGRLRHSDLSFEAKYPIVLPSNNILVDLIAHEEHVKNCHAGQQLLLAALRQRYWPLRGRNLVRRIVHQCHTCFRAKPKPSEQLMGDLPKDRVNSVRPFMVTGIDYCGPFMISQGPRRALTKVYVCIFICFATKAAHIELVNNLTTDAFIGALKRFMGRRGKPSKFYSDNATNFQGAHKKLNELQHLVKQKEHNERVSHFLGDDGIEWSFIPPRSPHMGGLWEANIKIFKYHFKRIVGNANLLYEEMNTVIIQIEACLNSRPLVPMSSDPNDLSYLSPGHFLIGRPLNALPEHDYKDSKISHLTRWQRVQKICQHFWTRWTNEYLVQLQNRHKWLKPKVNITIGTMVLIKDDQLPPLKWNLGRVTATIPGADGQVRVAEIKIRDGSIIRRSLTKLCVLPFQETNDDHIKVQN